MKPTEIKMQIVKNIGNFQSVRLEATYSLDSTSPSEIEECFKKARFDLEKSFISIYSKNEIKEGVNDVEEVVEKPEPNKQQFQRLLKDHPEINEADYTATGERKAYLKITLK